MTTKFLALFFTAAVMAAPAMAQADNWAGIGIGPTFSSYTNEPAGMGGNTEFHVTALADWQLQDIWRVLTEFRYSGYGFGQGDTSFDAHYIEIPVLLKPTLDMGGWYPYLLVGPNFGFKVSEGVSTTGGGSASTSAAKTFDFSLDFGIGAEVPVMDKLRVYAEFEYALGLIDALDYTDGSSGKTRGALLTFGAKLPF